MTHTCDACGRNYAHRHGLSRHILSKHPDVVEDALADDQDTLTEVSQT